MVTETLDAKARQDWAQKGEFLGASGTRSGVQCVNILPAVSRPIGHRPLLPNALSLSGSIKNLSLRSKRLVGLVHSMSEPG